MDALPIPTATFDIRPLERRFYARSPRLVARDLLGNFLVREGPVRLIGRIVEVEAYLGANDPAAHAAAGNTPRNSVLFGPPGYAYVYFIYGNHYCLNVSCEREGKAGGVLFRALEPLTGLQVMARARGIPMPPPRFFCRLTGGPGRLAQAFGITRNRDNGSDLTDPASGLWIGRAAGKLPRRTIQVTPRIGITKAAERPLRFILAGNPCVSGPKRSRSNDTPAPVDNRV